MMSEDSMSHETTNKDAMSTDSISKHTTTRRHYDKTNITLAIDSCRPLSYISLFLWQLRLLFSARTPLIHSTHFITHLLRCIVIL